MRFKFSDGNVEDLFSGENDNDDQRGRPRSGPIEKIADIAYDALRKHEIEPAPERPEESR